MEAKVQNFVKWLKEHSSKKKTTPPPPTKLDTGGFEVKDTHTQVISAAGNRTVLVPLQSHQAAGPNVCRASMKLPPLPREERRRLRHVARVTNSPAHVYEEIPASAVKDIIGLQTHGNSPLVHCCNPNTQFGYFVVPADGSEPRDGLLVSLNSANTRGGRHASGELADIIKSNSHKMSDTNLKLCSTSRPAHHPAKGSLFDSQASDMPATPTHRHHHHHHHQLHHHHANLFHPTRDAPSQSHPREVPGPGQPKMAAHLALVHCHKCPRPHGMYNGVMCQHYEHTSNDAVASAAAPPVLYPSQNGHEGYSPPEEKYHPGNVSIDSGFCSNRSSKTRLNRSDIVKATKEKSHISKDVDTKASHNMEAADNQEDEGVFLMPTEPSQHKPIQDIDKSDQQQEEHENKRVFVKTPYPRDIYAPASETSTYAMNEGALAADTSRDVSHDKGGGCSSASSNDTFSEYDLNSAESLPYDCDDCEYDYFLSRAEVNLKMKDDVKRFIRESESSDYETADVAKTDDTISLTTVTSLSDISVYCPQMNREVEALIKSHLAQKRQHRSLPIKIKKSSSRNSSRDGKHPEPSDVSHKSESGSTEKVIGSAHSAFHKVPSSRFSKKTTPAAGTSSKAATSSKENKEKRKSHSRKHHHHHSYNPKAAADTCAKPTDHYRTKVAELYEIPDLSGSCTVSGSSDAIDKLSCRATTYKLSPNCAPTKHVKKKRADAPAAEEGKAHQSQSQRPNSESGSEGQTKGGNSSMPATHNNKLLSDLMKLNHDRQLLVLF